MNYSQKRTLVGRVVYIALTVMAVTVLCVTLYTFFGASSKTEKEITITEPSQSKEPSTRPPVTEPPAKNEKPTDAATELPAVTPDDDEDAPTAAPPTKDWSSESLSMPALGVVAKGHDLKNAVYSLTMNDYRVHTGIDISCAVGDSVICCADGKIDMVGTDPFMGVTVIVNHGDGLLSYYRNLAPELAEGITVGASVEEGQQLGCIGETAIIEVSDEPHLHFELELSGKQIDPLSMLDYDEKTSSDASYEDDK